MRLWSLHPLYLDRQGLLALWRESLLAQKVLAGKTKGYRNHPQLDRFRKAKNPLAAIGAYLHHVEREAARRNYRFDRAKIAKPPTRKVPPIPVTRGQLRYELAHLLKKLSRRDPERFRKCSGLPRPDAHPLFRPTAGKVEGWERPLLSAVLAFLLAGAASGGAAAAERVPRPAAAPPPPFKKVLLVILENTTLKQALAEPYLAGLTKRGALLENYRGITHPSLPNYVALVAGDPLGVKDDLAVDLDQTSIVDLLEARGVSWGVYAEDYPGGCALGESSGHYARKHNPLISFRNIQTDPARCAKITGASAFGKDARAGKLPRFTLYIPDLLHDGHDTGVKRASEWLAGFLDPYLKDAKLLRDTLVVVTFDEDDYSGSENRVYTVLLGAGVVPGAVSAERYDHYSLLRTIEDAFGLGTLERNDAKARAIQGIWRAPARP